MGNKTMVPWISDGTPFPSHHRVQSGIRIYTLFLYPYASWQTAFVKNIGIKPGFILKSDGNADRHLS